MPIKIADDLPAAKTMASENIFVMTEKRAITQNIRPLKILLLNLMPKKIETETQLIRLLGNSPLQVDLELIHTKSHESKNTSQEHLLKFYKTFDEVRNQTFDGMIITGAPVESIPFEQVDYWDELCEIMEWTKTHVHSTLHICWGAQAGLYYHYGVRKVLLPRKLSGIYEQKVNYRKAILLRGFDDRFYVPHSRHTTVDENDIKNVKELRILASGEKTGPYILTVKGGRQVFVTGHSEYDADTLKNEYIRDLTQGLNPSIPENYFPDDDPEKTPMVKWRSHANLLFSNWLNYFVYQSTPYDITKIK